jgi:fructose-1,6-bisphosphatase II
MSLFVDLSLEMLRVVEHAAIACAHTMGQGDREGSDRVAVETMRKVLDDVPIDGTVVIGEGERDRAPMLFIGEKVGQAVRGQIGLPAVDIAVDPLEGTNLCATGAPNAITVLAASTQGGLDRPVRQNLRAIARALDRNVGDLVVMVLDRPRHEGLIADIRSAGARIRLIGDGDLSAGIAAAIDGSGVHAVMGTGGAPEGVLTAAAMRCLGGEIYARLVVATPDAEARCRAMGITDPHRIYGSADLASGTSITFVATGVTDGTLMKGVRFFGHGTRTSSIVMQNEPHQIRFIDTIHVNRTDEDLRIRF